jgi:hypothetical protein
MLRMRSNEASGQGLVFSVAFIEPDIQTFALCAGASLLKQTVCNICAGHEGARSCGGCPAPDPAHAQMSAILFRVERFKH